MLHWVVNISTIRYFLMFIFDIFVFTVENHLGKCKYIVWRNLLWLVELKWSFHNVVLRLRPEKKVPASEVRLPPNTTENERVVLKEGDDIEVTVASQVIFTLLANSYNFFLHQVNGYLEKSVNFPLCISTQVLLLKVALFHLIHLGLVSVIRGRSLWLVAGSPQDDEGRVCSRRLYWLWIYIQRDRCTWPHPSAQQEVII